MYELSSCAPNFIKHAQTHIGSDIIMKCDFNTPLIWEKNPQKWDTGQLKYTIDKMDLKNL
jgi:hypothetical protein